MPIASEAVKAYYDTKRINASPYGKGSLLDISQTGECSRKRVLLALGKDATHHPNDARLRTLESEELWRDWLADLIAESESTLDCRSIYRSEHAFGVGGCVSDTPEGKVLTIVQAVSQWAKNLPSETDFASAQAWLHLYGKQRGIAKAEIAYIHRETGGGPFVHEVTYDPEAGVKIEAELIELAEAIARQNVPEIPGTMAAEKFPCSWTSKTGGGHCQMFGHCWPTDETKGV